MALTTPEAAEKKGISRQGLWLAIGRGLFNARKTSGGMWLVEEDEKWNAYDPMDYPRRGDSRPSNKEEG